MKIIIATKNQGKLREFKRLLEPLGYDVKSQQEAGADIDVEETANTFSGNAKLKAQAIYSCTQTACIADDSGLSVDALGGEPGVFSARYAGEHGDDNKNIQKLLKNLEDIPSEKRSAHFECAICMITENGEEIAVTGRCEGEIGFALKGDGGFGYDPIFMVGDKSFAELSAEQKDKISHRGKALNKLLDKLKGKKLC